MVQHKGTGGIGKWFGPIVLVWFIALAAMGIVNIVDNPAILAPLNPLHVLGFLSRNGWPLSRWVQSCLRSPERKRSDISATK